MGNNRALRVLVIDDDDSITSFVAAALKMDGIHSMITASMEDALDGFDSMDYAMVITDIFMDGMGGLEGITAIRKKNPGAKIIAMSGGFTGMSPEDALKAATKIGADRVLAKPLTLDQVRQEVADLLA